MKKEINQLIRNLEDIQKIMVRLNIPHEVIEKEIKPFGNSCHMVLPKKFKNKKARIIINK